MLNEIKMQFGNIVRRSVSKFMGSYGTEIFGGYITNEDLSTDWDDKKAVASARRMIDGDAVIASTLRALKMPIMQSKARVEPASDDPGDVAIAEFVGASLFDNPFFTWSTWMEDALRHLDFGYEVMEKVYTLSPGGNELLANRLVWNFQHRKPETIIRWFNDDTGGIDYVEQEAVFVDGVHTQLKTVKIPGEKIFHIANEQEGSNWQGKSVLRSAWRSYKLKDLMMRLDAIKAEKFGVGMLRGKVKGGGTEAQVRAALESYRANEQGYLIHTDEFEIDLVKHEGSAGVDMIPSIQMHNQEIRSNILAEHLSLGKETTGARSLGDTFEKDFILSLGVIITRIEDAMNLGRGNMQNIKQIVDKNFAGVTKYPKLVIERPGADKVFELVNMAKELVPLKVLTPDNELENKFRSFGGLTPIDDDVEIDRSRQPVVPVKEPEEEETSHLSLDGWRRGRRDDGKGGVYSQYETGEYGDPKWTNTQLISTKREPTDFEKKILNFELIAQVLDEKDDAIIKSNNEIKTKITDELVARALTILSGSKSIEDIKEKIDRMEVPFLREMENEIVKQTKEAFQFGRETMIDEIARQEDAKLAAKPKPPLGLFDDLKRVDKSIRPLVNSEIKFFSSNILTEWQRVVFDSFTQKSLNSKRIRERVNRVSINKFNEISRHMANRGFGMGRTLETIKAKDKIDHLIRSEILDNATCINCERDDGVTFEIGSALFEKFSSGPNPDCLGTNDCRGLNLAWVKQ